MGHATEKHQDWLGPWSLIWMHTHITLQASSQRHHKNVCNDFILLRISPKSGWQKICVPKACPQLKLENEDMFLMLWRKSRDKWKVVTAQLGVEHWQRKPSAPGVQFSTQIQTKAPLASPIHFVSIVFIGYLQGLSLSGFFWRHEM